ncbi:MAG: geranylgeranyl reductase family protein [Candidatus Coatesbacteria bacterium]|nr:geranylgeranyl reductase family protein [Candidatus Coatesbacteria bacterium]
MSADFEVIVVGGGPAGARCALDLASAGVEVALLEKESIPRFKLCAGGLSARAKDLLGLDVTPSILNEVEAIEFLGHHRVRLRKDSPAIFGWVVDRERFDALIVDEARKAGCIVFEQSAVETIDAREKKAKLTCKGGAVFGARAVVGADGARSVIRRGLGVERLKRRGVTVMFELEPIGADTLADNVIRLDFGVIPWGYVWVFPYGAKLSVGAMTSKSHLPDAKRGVLEYVAQNEALTARFKARFLGGCTVPFWTRERGQGRANCILVGDAAGLVDAFIGEGLTWAVKSGQLAASAILDARRSVGSYARLHSEYLSLLRREVFPELRRAYWFSRAAYKCPELVFKMVSRLARDGDLFGEIARSSLSYRSLMGKVLKQLVWPRRYNTR